MKKYLAALCAVLFLLPLCWQSAGAAGPNGQLRVEFHDAKTGTYMPATVEQVNLTLNGAPLVGDVPAILRDGRTLVPVRLVGEALGAQVLWVQETSQAILLKGADTIVLTRDSAAAQVNGVPISLPDNVPASLVRYQGGERTLVPLRFVSERLGAEVTWDAATYTVAITTAASPTPSVTPLPTLTPGVTPTPTVTPQPSASPKPTAAPTPSATPTVTPKPSATPSVQYVNGITTDSNAQTILIATDHKPSYQVTDFGDRLAVDVKGAVLAPGYPGKIVVDNEYISAIRYAEHDSSLYPEYKNTVRVVLDLQNGATYAKNVSVQTTDYGVILSTFNEDRAPDVFVPTVPIDPKRSTIVIDPGHGGKRSGAVYEGVMEKSINLSVSLKLQALLLEKGYNVVMTRTDDTDVDLYQRADIANAVEADLFVSLHSNAADKVPTFQGIYTYYHPSSQRGARLAQTIQTPLARATGAIDRGIKDADFVVLRETDMCAVLVEMGFMTNHDELMNLINPVYQDKLAAGVAEGIVAYLNTVK